MPTLSDLVQATVEKLSQVPGTTVQQYAEPRIASLINDAFTMAFEEAWWDDFMETKTIPLDGSTGLPSVDVSSAAYGLKKFRDIKYVFVGDQARPLVRSPERINPNNIIGTTAKFYEPVADATKVFRVLPYQTVDPVSIRFRKRPAEFQLDDEVVFDKLALVYGAAYLYAVDDATNPGQAEKFRNFYNTRISALKASDAAAGGIPLNPYTPNVHNTWEEWP